ncbi:MAG TPA: class I SAM-dependent methyltransferase [Flavobacteriales bacterium]|nr:class I SAM-dependent methyltransferase [Flavobacteriales bacterium]
MKLRFERRKPRHTLLSICYRLAKLPFASARGKMRFYLDLNWIGWRLAIEQAERMYGFGESSMRRKNLEFLLPRMKPGARVLDLGCKYGEISAIVAEKAERVIAVDHDPQALEKARAAHPATNLEFIHADAFDVLEKETAPVDLVILSHILEHLEKPEAMLARLKAHATHCYIELPDLDASYLNHYRQLAGARLQYTDNDHIWEFDRDSLLEVIEGAGWKILDSEYRYGVQKHWCGRA